MSRTFLKAGDRVRITSANAMPGYRLGDTGTVDHGPCPAATGDHYYVVQMDDDGDGPVIFLAEEIESVD
jgi:hypothetical protein